jgi:hypothetical protein
MICRGSKVKASVLKSRIQMRRRKWKDRGEKRMIEEAVTFRSEVENVQKTETTKKTETLFPTAFLFVSF